MALSTAKQVFVSYSSRDKEAANAICAALEAAGVSCWIAPRDLSAGAQWGSGIVAAIEECEAVLVVFSSASNDSPQVVREMELAVSRRLPLIPVRVEDVMPTDDMQFFLGVSHWFNAFPKQIEDYLPQIVAATQGVLSGKARTWSTFTRRLPRKRGAQLALVGSVAIAAVIGLGLLKPATPGTSFGVGQLPTTSGPMVGEAHTSATWASASEDCDSGPPPPSRPARDIEGLYPGMKLSDARKILFCRYPEVSQQASAARFHIAGGRSATLRTMEFRYPPVGGRHRGGEVNLIYDGEDGDGVLLYVSHLHYFDENSAPPAGELLDDFVRRYGTSTRRDEQRGEKSEAVVYSASGEPMVNPVDVAVRSGALSPQEAKLIRTNTDYRRRLYRCRSAVTGSRFTIEDMCNLAVGIRLTQSGDNLPSAMLLTSFDMALTRKQALGG